MQREGSSEIASVHQSASSNNVLDSVQQSASFGQKRILDHVGIKSALNKGNASMRFSQSSLMHDAVGVSQTATQQMPYSNQTTNPLIYYPRSQKGLNKSVSHAG